MPQKQDRTAITWTEEQADMLAEIARIYEDDIQMNGIHPYTRTSHTAQRQPNLSGIVRFLMLDKLNRARRVNR